MNSLKKTFPLILLSISLTIATSLYGESLQWYETMDQAIAVAQKKDSPIFLHIYADWCPTCKKLMRDVYPHPLIAKEFQGYVMLKINGEKYPEITRRFRVRGYPTLVFLDKNGYQLNKLEGALDKNRLISYIHSSYQEKDREKNLLDSLKKNPESVESNFNTGVYYSGIENHGMARKYYMDAWMSKESMSETKMNSLFNAAVSSMELSDFSTAVSYWNQFIVIQDKNGGDYARARLYRGIALKNLGLNNEAADDFRYAGQNASEVRSRNMAMALLKSLE